MNSDESELLYDDYYYDDYYNYDYDDNLQSLHQEQSNYIESLLQSKELLSTEDVLDIIINHLFSDIDLNNFSLLDLYNFYYRANNMDYNGFLNIVINGIDGIINKLINDLDNDNYDYYDVSHMLGNLLNVQEKIIQEQNNIKQQEYTNSSKEDFISKTLNILIHKDETDVINKLCDFYSDPDNNKYRPNLENIIEFKLTEDSESKFDELISNDKLNIKVFELASDILKAKGCYKDNVWEFSKFELITSIYNNKLQKENTNLSLQDKFKAFKLIPEYESNSNQPEYKSSSNPMFVKCIKDCIEDKDLNSKIQALSECYDCASSLGKDTDKYKLIDNIIKDECKDIIKGCTFDYYKSCNNVNNNYSFALKKQYVKFFDEVLGNISKNIYKNNDTEFKGLLNTIVAKNEDEQQSGNIMRYLRDHQYSKNL